MRHGTTTTSVHDAIGIATLGAGYVLRADGVAVGLAELTPPDLRLHDAAALERLLDATAHLLRTHGERMVLLTAAVPADPRPLLAALDQRRATATDFTSYAVGRALHELVVQAAGVSTVTLVRWVLAVPSVLPEEPPPGTWGELFPAAVVGRLTRLRGDPIAEALSRTRRLCAAFAALGLEPPPRLLPAPEIAALLARALDPIHAERQSPVGDHAAPRPLHIAESAT